MKRKFLVKVAKFKIILRDKEEVELEETYNSHGKLGGACHHLLG